MRGRRVRDFNPRSPHGERRLLRLSNPQWDLISTHAPRTGSDTKADGVLSEVKAFQPTLPARGATRKRNFDAKELLISTHAPRTGSDAYQYRYAVPSDHFNPRSPHGERLGDFRACSVRPYFNPRSPHGERQGRKPSRLPPRYFNPRSPHGERQYAQVDWEGETYFNPRSPHGERHAGGTKARAGREISTHAPRTGSD